MVRIAVCGGGVNGFGSAVRILESFPLAKVTIITKDVTPNTTGDGSAGLWMPYLIGATSEDKIKQWGDETFKFLHELWIAGQRGICLIPAMLVTRESEKIEDPIWKNSVFGFRILKPKELKFLSEQNSQNYSAGFTFVTFTGEPTYILPYLMNRFTSLGGKIREVEVTNIEDLALDYDIVVNCTGIGSLKLVPDSGMYPIRGQVMRVRAPWLYQIFLDNSDDGNYIIPNTETVVLGGTHQVNNFNVKVDNNDREFIINGCRKITPSLQHAPIWKEWVGLRPGRDNLRLERSDIQIPKEKGGKSKLIVIHNYGHGGCGVTLFWGCAKEVTTLVDQAIREEFGNKVCPSKL